MCKRVFVFCGLLLALNGCVYDDEPMPRITDTRVEARVPKPLPAVKPIAPRRQASNDWFPPSRVEKGWKAIVVHHSATARGNAARFHKDHKNGHKWKGIGYDFVIGNGRGSGDGQVEVTFRWRDQIPGAHCGGTPGNWANKDGIGICLVGDFTRRSPTRRQMQSLVKLIKFLQQRYKIPTSRIYGHRGTPGYTNGTKCPGKFPMSRLKSMLGN